MNKVELSSHFYSRRVVDLRLNLFEAILTAVYLNIHTTYRSASMYLNL